MSRRLLHGEYLKLAMSHRFCLVAPGDFVASHKITEAIAIGGAGGCIPVFVVPHERGGVASMLPYASWLDYCAFSYAVRESDITLLPSMLQELARRPPSEIDAKRAALRRVRDAFVVRPNSTFAAPTAGHFVLAEMCDAAARMRARSRTPSRSVPLGRCTLGPSPDAWEGSTQGGADGARGGRPSRLHV